MAGTVKLAVVMRRRRDVHARACPSLDSDIVTPHGINLGLDFLASSKPEEAECDLKASCRFDVLSRRVLLRALPRRRPPLPSTPETTWWQPRKNIARLLHIEVQFNGRFFGILPPTASSSLPTGSHRHRPLRRRAPSSTTPGQCCWHPSAPTRCTPPDARRRQDPDIPHPQEQLTGTSPDPGRTAGLRSLHRRQDRRRSAAGQADSHRGPAGAQLPGFPFRRSSRLGAGRPGVSRE